MTSLDTTASQGTLALDQSRSAMPAKLGKSANLEAVRKAATDFETVFVSQMLGHMFDGVKTYPLFGGGHGEEMFRSMMTDEYAKQIVNRGGFGISGAVMKTMLAEQEKAQ